MDFGYQDGAGRDEIIDRAAEHRRLSPEDIQKKKEHKRAWAAMQGRACAIERANQRLPGRVGTLSPVELCLLRNALASVNRHTPSHILSGALIVAACLVTGRKVADIADSPLRKIQHANSPSDVPHGLIGLGRSRGWWLPSGSPSSKQKKKRGGIQAYTVAQAVWLPCPDLFIKIFCAHFRAVRKNKDMAQPLQVFERNDAATRDQVLRNLRQDALLFLHHAYHEYGCDTKLASVESWLGQTIAHSKNGDLASAMLITNNYDKIADSQCHYSCLSQEKIQTIHAQAITQFATLPKDSSLPKAIEKSWVGSRYNPCRDSLSKLARNLREKLEPVAVKPSEGRQNNICKIHNAMLLYTYLVVGVSTGFRAVRYPLPHPSMIDDETGFVLFDDKKTQDSYKTRVIWLPRVARTQLLYFHQHIEVLKSRLGAAQQAKWKRMFGEPKDIVPLFMFNPDGKLIIATPGVVRDMFGAEEWHLPMNAGRHYLRSKMIGNCDSDTLQAFLGHWHRGMEAWSGASALDPIAYRDALSTHLESLMESDGWTAVCGLSPPPRPRSNRTLPTSVLCATSSCQ